VTSVREVVVKKWLRLKFVSVFMMGGALLVKLTRGTKMQESPENNLCTEDSICLFVFNVLLRDCAYLTCVGSDGSRSGGSGHLGFYLCCIRNYFYYYFYKNNALKLILKIIMFAKVILAKAP
jgi:hypothetical protein